MSVAELTHGRGAPMSAHELAVMWPAFFAYEQRTAERVKRQRAAAGPARRGFGS